MRHSYLPADLRNCILKPIPKPHKDPTSSENYRPVALAPILSKILEWCILIQFNDYFVTSPLQFGFKKSMCTTLCTGLVKNIAAHYMTHGSPVYSCLLDASKALASYPGAQGGGERAPGTHCLRMRLISQISGKIVYFSNLPCYVDVIIY